MHLCFPDMEFVNLLKIWRDLQSNVRLKRQDLSDRNGWGKPLKKLSQQDRAKILLY